MDCFCFSSSLRSKYPHDDTGTNPGFVLSPVIAQRESAPDNNCSVKVSIEIPESQQPVTFTCDGKNLTNDLKKKKINMKPNVIHLISLNHFCKIKIVGSRHTVEILPQNFRLWYSVYAHFYIVHILKESQQLSKISTLALNDAKSVYLINQE